MAVQYFQTVNVEPPLANLTAITATVETALWTTSQYSPIPAYDAGRPGKMYRLQAGGIMSFAGTGTLIITPRFGTSVSGVTMGANPAAQTTPGVTTNAPWFLEFVCVTRTVGAAGSNSTVIGTGFFTTGATGTAGTAVSFAIGGTSATVDLSVAQGICIGWTLSVAGTVTPQWVAFQSLN